MGKRSNGEGTIYKRGDGRWCAAAYKQVAGKVKRVYVYGSTQKEVKAKLKQMQEQQEDEGGHTEESMTLADWMKEWLAVYKKPTVKGSTYGNYVQVVNVHIVKNKIGTITLSELQTADLQKFYDAKRSQETHLHRPMSPRMVNYIAVLINGALDQAVKLGKIEKNPNKAVVLPKKEKHEIEPLTETEVKMLLKQVEGTKLFLPILIKALAC